MQLQGTFWSCLPTPLASRLQARYWSMDDVYLVLNWADRLYLPTKNGGEQTWLHASKALSKGQSPDDVECHHFKLLAEIQSFRPPFSNFVDERVNDGGNQGLLFSQTSVWERMWKRPAHFCVLDRIPLAYYRMHLICKATTIIESALDECLVAWPWTVDVFPWLSCIEGKLVWRGPNNGSFDTEWVPRAQ